MPRALPLPTPLRWPIPAVLPIGLVVATVAALRFTGQDLDVYRSTGWALLAGVNPYTDGLEGTWLPCVYTPFSAILFVPIALVGHTVAMFVVTAASLACLWFSVGRFIESVWADRGRSTQLELQALCCLVLLTTESVSQTLGFGQVNFFLMALVIGDVARRRPSAWQGVGVGLATSFKLIPGIFILYLLCTRRWRAAITASGTFAATILFGWIAMPAGSWSYWIDGLGTDPRHIGGTNSLVNGSLLGVLARPLGYPAARPWWIALAVPLLVAGMWLAVVVRRRLGEIAGITTVSFVALVVSPISWNHYWVWFTLPALHLGRRAWETRDCRAIALTAIWVLPFFVAPFRFIDDDRWLGPHHTLVESMLGGVYAVWAILGLGSLAVWVRRGGALRWLGPQAPDNAMSPTTMLAR